MMIVMMESVRMIMRMMMMTRRSVVMITRGGQL